MKMYVSILPAVPSFELSFSLSLHEYPSTRSERVLVGKKLRTLKSKLAPKNELDSFL